MCIWSPGEQQYVLTTKIGLFEAEARITKKRVKFANHLLSPVSHVQLTFSDLDGMICSGFDLNGSSLPTHTLLIAHA
jgi:hypothetical protein